MKYLVVIALVALLVFLLLRRLRPYLRLVQQFIDTLRKVRQMSATGSNPQSQKAEKLVCCETCGTWIPSGRALTTGSTNALFCSLACANLTKKRTQGAS